MVFVRCVYGHGMVFDVFMGMEWLKKIVFMRMEWYLFDVFMGMEHCVCLVCIYVWCVHEPTAEHASPQNKLDEAYQVTARQI